MQHFCTIAFVFIIFMQSISASLHAQSDVRLENQHLRLQWERTPDGYVLAEITINPKNEPLTLDHPQGGYVGLYSQDKPDTTVNTKVMKEAQGHVFDDYKYIVKRWRDNFRPVPLNTAGASIWFFPAQAKATSQGVEFIQQDDRFTAEITWTLDRLHTHDVVVEMRVKAKKAGYFSFATPTLFNIGHDDLEWAMLPGYFQGRRIQPDLLRAYAYGQGVPSLPVVVRERAASTLAPLIQNKRGVTLAVIPAPGIATDPWSASKDSRAEWRLGLSLMNRQGQLSPTLYYPVLGEVDSYMNAGDERIFRFRYSLQRNEWFNVYKHAIYDVYEFEKAVKLKNTRESLSNRILSMLKYLKDDSTSLWNVRNYQGLQIGAQSYLGGVVGADKDAMKNADYGAMWMLARLTGDSLLNATRLLPARNFKLTQQQTEGGFFKGAAMGQYYLWKSERFTEEWGDHVEPIALTYYTMLDIGNILLFEPDDEELKDRLRSGADKLLDWQQTDGSWVVAYDRHTEQPVFTDQLDLRPTFYGLLVAYRLLGDEKYLQGAIKGANWYVENAVDQGHFLGVCGDVRFVPDFATAQSAQALLDLYELTTDKTYLQAAIDAAKIYTGSIYTHPITSQRLKEVNGKQKEDWEITQVGLSFEHGGTLGSANGGGPIPLASHAGLFVRMADLTGEKLFLDMARAAAWGRDAFVDSATHVASYYWTRMDEGPGPFPHHAWWQVGWITDYLMAEITSRSNGQISFPKGFITPKVGPHQPYGFAAGEIFGASADLYLPEDLVSVSNPRVDFMAAKATHRKDVYLILLNNSTRDQQSSVSLGGLQARELSSQAALLDEKGDKLQALPLEEGVFRVDIPALGLRVVKLGN
ncbi:glycerophosphoryl diester phosphodiesterase [Parapedobacter sp. DT-150]|uniref:GIY-YIG nuclease family protein n=1 Tax=Parapedobacter sp. DT-150 TaxID=3396162 RepID=UPI003F1A3260